MSLANRPRVRFVRSLFLSDVHLGCKHSQAESLLDFLEQYVPQQLYVVGDFIDGWQLKRRWRWYPIYDRLLARIMELQRKGTKLYYAPGNHDAFLRRFLANFGVVEVRDQFIHIAADGKTFLVMHGDQFDSVEHSAPWLSVLGMYVYDAMLSLNRVFNRVAGRRPNCYALCGSIKGKVKGLVRRASNFESQLLEAARSEKCDGIICGHIHSPRIFTDDRFIYCNTGDWVEHCTAMIEDESGRFELIRHDGTVIDSIDALELETTDDVWEDSFASSLWDRSDGRDELPEDAWFEMLFA